MRKSIVRFVSHLFFAAIVAACSGGGGGGETPSQSATDTEAPSVPNSLVANSISAFPTKGYFTFAFSFPFLSFAFALGSIILPHSDLFF